MRIDFPSEKTIEDYIFESIKQDGACPLSGDAADRVWRQYEIPGYGIADIVKVWLIPNGIELTVLELKNEPLKEAHVGQLMRYMRALEKVAERASGTSVTVRGELAGPLDPQKGDLVYMLPYLPRQISVFEIFLSMDCGFVANPVGTEWHSVKESAEWFQGKADSFCEMHRVRFEDFESKESKGDRPGKKAELQIVS